MAEKAERIKTMKLAEKLAAMSNEQVTKEETVINEIVNFFAEKFASGEMMEIGRAHV